MGAFIGVIPRVAFSIQASGKPGHREGSHSRRESEYDQSPWGICAATVTDAVDLKESGSAAEQRDVESAGTLPRQDADLGS
jgi:hypothetical protein